MEFVAMPVPIERVKSLNFNSETLMIDQIIDQVMTRVMTRCWLALIWLHIMYTFITHRMCDSRISFSDLFLEFYRTLTNQTATKLKVFSNFNIAYNKNILFKPTLIAESLEDLMDNKALMIAGRAAIPYLKAYEDPYFKDIATTIVTKLGYECGLIAHTQAIQHMATGVMVKGWQHNVTQFDDTVYLAKPEYMCWLALIWLHIMYTFITH
ncbi:unnamed protein product, partial [Oppiella nova]